MVMKYILFLSVLSKTFTINVRPKVTLHNSLSLLEDLLATQIVARKDVEHFKSFIDTDPEKEEVIEDFIYRCRSEETKANMFGKSEYLSNPINAFSLVTRMSKDLVNIEEMLKNTGYLRNWRSTYPSADDLVGAVEGFTRLQILYDLNVHHLANGTLTSRFVRGKHAFIEHVSSMTASDCYELALVKYDEKDRSRNIAWMLEALNKIRDGGVAIAFTETDLLDRIAAEYFNMGNYENAIIWLQKSMDLTPFRPENRERLKVLEIMEAKLNKKLNTCMGDFTTNPKGKKKIKANVEDSSYPGLCLKKTKLNTKNIRLKCFYKFGPSKFLKIAPVKTELINESPFIAKYYDVISDADIAILQRLARPRFQPGVPTDRDGKINEKDDGYCVHQVGWLRDDISDTTTRLSKTISDITDLDVNMRTAEEFQVSNYGIGGFYGPHYDFIRPNVPTTIGKTFATIVFYLTDIQVGGATIFPGLNITVYPEKHSALFWMNLDEWGRNDYRTAHAACPTLRGNRWVAGKWISLVGQELRKPCPVTKPVKPVKPPPRKDLVTKSRAKILKYPQEY